MTNKNLSRRNFLRISGFAGISLNFINFLSFNNFFTEPPLSPNNGGKTILPSALEVGDIIISTTTKKKSEVIRKLTNSEFSHAMVVYDISNKNNPELMESVSKGVRIITYNDMMNESKIAVSIRKSNLISSDKKKMKEWLITKIGADYDYWAVIKDFLSIGFYYNEKKYSLDIGYKNDDEDNNKYYCSELIFQLYKEIGIDLIKFDEWNRFPQRFVEMSYFNSLDYVGHLKYL